MSDGDRALLLSLFLYLLYAGFREADFAPRNARVLLAESPSRVCVCVRACWRQSLTLTDPPVLTPFVRSYIYIHSSCFNQLRFLCIYVCVRITTVVFLAPPPVRLVGRLLRPTGERAERSEADRPGGKGRKKAWDRKRRTKEA